MPNRFLAQWQNERPEMITSEVPFGVRDLYALTQFNYISNLILYFKFPLEKRRSAKYLQKSVINQRNILHTHYYSVHCLFFVLIFKHMTRNYKSVAPSEDVTHFTIITCKTSSLALWHFSLYVTRPQFNVNQTYNFSNNL